MSPTNGPALTSPIFAQAELRDDDFVRLTRLIYEKSGIVLGENKRQLVASRLARRLRALGLGSYGAYCDRVLQADPSGTELRELLNCITTNKTEFFRENHHFEFLKGTVFPELRERARQGGSRKVKIWSAGCSTGEEPYTIALTALAALGDGALSVEIVATDIDTDVLAHAQHGRYAAELITPVPRELQGRYFTRIAGPKGDEFQVAPELQRMIQFRQLNFVDSNWPVEGPIDLIFCRNVMIYFDRPTQQRIVERFRDLLGAGGYLFLGHSESLHGMSELFTPLRGTVYRAVGDGVRPASSQSASPSATPRSPRSIASPPPGPATRHAQCKPGASAPARSRRDRVNVIIGGVECRRDDVVIRTLLGSCVCACLWDPVARVGGMNHFMLPGGTTDRDLPTRYGVHAMEMLINGVLKLGGERSRLQAKAFGAAHVLAKVGMSSEVPRKNAQFIKDFLQSERIALISSRLGGSAPVEVLFLPIEGRALVRAVSASEAGNLAEEESRFGLEVSRELTRPVESAVELF